MTRQKCARCLRFNTRGPLTMRTGVREVRIHNPLNPSHPILILSELCHHPGIPPSTLYSWRALDLPTLDGSMRGTHPNFLYRAVLAWLSDVCRPKHQASKGTRKRTAGR